MRVAGKANPKPSHPFGLHVSDRTDAEPASPTDDRVEALVAEGAELFNRGEFWEAHEAWEVAWHSLRDAGASDLADLLQGLILATAAFENLDRGKPRGFAVQGAKALSRMRRHEGLGSELGIADERGFYEALLDVYLRVQRERIGDLDALPVDVPELRIQP